jgi:hypothetical protein
VVALGALGACQSQPGNRRVVGDVIESLAAPDITVLDEAQEACMLERLEVYTDDQLADIADNNETWDPSGQGDTPADATEGMRLFIADFEQCTTDTGSTAPTESSAPTDTTTPTASTESAEATEG